MKTKTRARWYVGHRTKSGALEAFPSIEAPTVETYGDRYTHTIGPFRTKLAALVFVQRGDNNPHCVTVAQAERQARRNAASIFMEWIDGNIEDARNYLDTAQEAASVALDRDPIGIDQAALAAAATAEEALHNAENAIANARTNLRAFMRRAARRKK